MRPESKVIILVLCLAVCGCSVGMAASGKPDPNLSIINKGEKRSNVELQLGKPVSSQMNADGTKTDTYEYEVGNEPSPLRAAMHGVLDVLSLCIWEVIGTPIEYAIVEKKTCTVSYDVNDCVQTMTARAK
jgi:hypothetical protein